MKRSARLAYSAKCRTRQRLQAGREIQAVRKISKRRIRSPLRCNVLDRPCSIAAMRHAANGFCPNCFDRGSRNRCLSASPLGCGSDGLPMHPLRKYPLPVHRPAGDVPARCGRTRQRTGLEALPRRVDRAGRRPQRLHAPALTARAGTDRSAAQCYHPRRAWSWAGVPVSSLPALRKIAVQRRHLFRYLCKPSID
ncbi:hypothetical protein GALL_452160 [mine drainage metagenome]|uniref:Uncharacterized protein n=1 Tax=mine drainage metagenome TaxID=410659 RepID=A0A1J5PNS1_9ZZZZ